MIKKKILITGAAGFIGFHVVNRFLESGDFLVVGIDNINDYYDIRLKHLRLKEQGIDALNLLPDTITTSEKHKAYTFLKSDIANHDFIVDFMIKEKFDYVVNLAAQAGVRHSIDKPKNYIHSNINGFLSLLEGCRFSKVKHFVYASTSSVYGLNSNMPFNEKQPTQHPISLYSATKKANEMMAHSYSQIFDIPTTGLRFFTVYGPWGRPDMAYFLFANAISNDKPIDVFNNGKMKRDFTYIDDIVESIIRVVLKPAKGNLRWDSDNPDPSSSSAPYRIFNIGNSEPIDLFLFIDLLEKNMGKKAKKNMRGMQCGDVISTHSDTSSLQSYISFSPKTSLEEGISKFVEWYEEKYKYIAK